MTYVEKKKATQIVSHHSAFDNEHHSWQESFFRILAVKNTYDIFYKIDICSRKDHEAYLWILLKSDASLDNLKEFLESNGYRDLDIHDTTVAEVWIDDDDVDYIVEA